MTVSLTTAKKLLQSFPIFTFANQVGLDMFKTTLIALQDIILDDVGRKILCSEFSKIMQQVTSLLYALMILGKCPIGWWVIHGLVRPIHSVDQTFQNKPIYKTGLNGSARMNLGLCKFGTFKPSPSILHC